MKKKITPGLPKAKKLAISVTQTNEPKGVIHNGKLLDIRKSNAILSEANRLANSQLLIDLITDVESVACAKIYHEAQTTEELQFGKGMLNSLDILKKKILNLSKTNIK